MNDIPAEYLERQRPRGPRFPLSLFWDDYGLRMWAFGTLCTLAGIIVIAALLTFFIGGGLLLDQRSCASEANGIGLAHKWGPLEGCLLRTPGGQYIPDSQYSINHPQP